MKDPRGRQQTVILVIGMVVAAGLAVRQVARSSKELAIWALAFFVVATPILTVWLERKRKRK